MPRLKVNRCVGEPRTPTIPRPEAGEVAYVNCQSLPRNAGGDIRV